MSDMTPSDDKIENVEPAYLPRSLAWISLMKTKGWLKDGKIVLPADVMVYFYFPPATTDINTIESISLQRVTEVTEHFILHRVSANEEEYYLWEDVQCVRIRTKRPSRSK